MVKDESAFCGVMNGVAFLAWVGLEQLILHQSHRKSKLPVYLSVSSFPGTFLKQG